MRKFLIRLCTALMVVLFLAGDVSFAGIRFFTDEQDFHDAGYGYDADDFFGCSAAEPGGVCSGFSPVNSETNDGCFNACLLPGFEFIVVDDGGMMQYDAVGTGFLGVGLPAVGPKFFADEARWTFIRVTSVGFKVIGDLINPVDVDCTFSGPDGVLGVATVHGSLQGTFIGAIAGQIMTVDCVEQVDGSRDLYGSLQLGHVDDVHICGDGILFTMCEECDDGNNEDGDGCAADCTLEEPVPAVPYPGVIVLVLLLLTITTTILLWRRRSEA